MATNREQASVEEVRRVAEDPIVRQILLLLKAGVPFNVAMSWDAAERMGWIVAAGVLEGGEFDWQTCSWKKRE